MQRVQDQPQLPALVNSQALVVPKCTGAIPNNLKTCGGKRACPALLNRSTANMLWNATCIAVICFGPSPSLIKDKQNMCAQRVPDQQQLPALVISCSTEAFCLVPKCADAVPTIEDLP